MSRQMMLDLLWYWGSLGPALQPLWLTAVYNREGGPLLLALGQSRHEPCCAAGQGLFVSTQELRKKGKPSWACFQLCCSGERGGLPQEPSCSVPGQLPSPPHRPSPDQPCLQTEAALRFRKKDPHSHAKNMEVEFLPSETSKLGCLKSSSHPTAWRQPRRASPGRCSSAFAESRPTSAQGRGQLPGFSLGLAHWASPSPRASLHLQRKKSQAFLEGNDFLFPTFPMTLVSRKSLCPPPPPFGARVPTGMQGAGPKRAARGLLPLA